MALHEKEIEELVELTNGKWNTASMKERLRMYKLLKKWSNFE